MNFVHGLHKKLACVQLLRHYKMHSFLVSHLFFSYLTASFQRLLLNIICLATFFFWLIRCYPDFIFYTIHSNRLKMLFFLLLTTNKKKE